MQFLKGKYCNLRALERSDLDFLYEIENDTQFWLISQQKMPFSKDFLTDYIQNSSKSIYEAGQIRFLIEDFSKNRLGFIDLYDFCPKNRRAGVGIFIKKEFRRQGFAFDALQVLEDYAFKMLDLHQLYAEIISDNQQSIKLFEKSSFKSSMVKKDWIFYLGEYKDLGIYQKIINN